MRNIKLTIAYDGSEFSGFQIQPGQPTVQGALLDVARKLTQEEVQVFGSGRTDAGVHALGHVVNFKTQSQMSPKEFQRAFNALLPSAVRVMQAEEVGPDFHPRFHSLAKTYQYRIYRGKIVPPFEEKYVLHDPYSLNVPAMAEAARLFEGEHDFSSFAASTGSEEGDANRSPIREIYLSRLYTRRGTIFHGQGFLAALTTSEAWASSQSEIAPAAEPAMPKAGEVRVCEPEPTELLYVVRGKSFLRYMVRKIVGTLLDVGRGRLQPSDIPALFELKDRSHSGPTAPPHGLYLVSVEYPDPWKF
jgi:tRNA pseudouridine38-40 synthase